MRSHFMEYRATAGFALAFPVFAIAWLFTAPHGMTFLTFAAMALLAAGVGAWALNTWRQVQTPRALPAVSNRTADIRNNGQTSNETVTSLEVRGWHQ